MDQADYERMHADLDAEFERKLVRMWFGIWIVATTLVCSLIYAAVKHHQAVDEALHWKEIAQNLQAPVMHRIQAWQPIMSDVITNALALGQTVVITTENGQIKLTMSKSLTRPNQ